MAAPGSNPMRSLTRAIHVLEQLQRYDGPRRLKTIADDCGMSPATALRILRVLCETGLAAQADKSYSVGPGALPAARSYLETDPLPQTARPVLQRLSDDSGLTASLYTRIRFERVLVERVVGVAYMGYELPQGRRLPLTVGAAGKALLFDQSDEELADVLEASIGLGHEDAQVDLAILRDRLDVGGPGYSLSEDERAMGIASVAVPLPVPAGRPVSESISLTGLAGSTSLEQLAEHVPALRMAARKIADSLPRHAG